MSSVMMDIDRIQVAVSNMLADWLRQMFTAFFLAACDGEHRLEAIAGQLSRFPDRCGSHRSSGHAKFDAPPVMRRDMTAGLNQILQETITGHQVVKSFGAEDFESKRFQASGPTIEDRKSAVCGAAGARRLRSLKSSEP